MSDLHDFMWFMFHELHTSINSYNSASSNETG